MGTAPEFIRGIWGTIKTENRFNGFLETDYALSLRNAKEETDKSVWQLMVIHTPPNKFGGYSQNTNYKKYCLSDNLKL